MKDPGRRGHGDRPYNHRSKTPKSIKLSAQQSLAPTFPRTHLSVHRRAAGVCGSRNRSLHILTFSFFSLPTYVYLRRPWVFPCACCLSTMRSCWPPVHSALSPFLYPRKSARHICDRPCSGFAHAQDCHLWMAAPKLNPCPHKTPHSHPQLQPQGHL